MDNVPKGRGATTVKNGLAFVPDSRHPYEYPLNEAYQSFLASGLHNRNMTWGRHLAFTDVSEPEAWDCDDYPAEWILDRIDAFYDVRHEALSRTRFMQGVSPDVLYEYSTRRGPPPLEFRVIMFTKNRLASFARCWESVRAAFPIKSSVGIEVRFDLDPAMSYKEESRYLDYLEAMQDDLGPAQSLDIIPAQRPLGLRQSILTSWKPTSNHEYAIFLVSRIRHSVTRAQAYSSPGTGGRH